MGIVCTVQKLSIAFKDGATQQITVRETDCFEKRNNEWQLIHQHASVPSGGDWDGKIAEA
jgi:ketosteroid isomerase-like protein